MSSTIGTISAGANGVTLPFVLSGNSGSFSFQCVATGLDAADGVLSVQYSNDGVNYSLIPSLTETLASGASDNHFNVNAINHAFYIVDWVAGSNTAGSIVVTTNL